MGDEPRRAAPDGNLLADIAARGFRRCGALDWVWPAVGHRRPDQHLPALFSPCLGTVGVVSAREATAQIVLWNRAGIDFLLGNGRSLVGPQLRGVREIHFCPLQLRCRTSAGQWSRGEWDVDAVAASVAERARDAPL